MKYASARSEDTAALASLDHLEAQAAPTHPGAPPPPRGGSPWASANRLTPPQTRHSRRARSTGELWLTWVPILCAVALGCLALLFARFPSPPAEDAELLPQEADEKGPPPAKK